MIEYAKSSRNTWNIEPPTMKALQCAAARPRSSRKPPAHTSKLSNVQNENQHKRARPEQEQEHPLLRKPDLPATPLIDRSNPRKRKWPDSAVYTERVTRSRLKKVDKKPEQSILPEPDKGKSIETTQLLIEPTTKRHKTKVESTTAEQGPMQPTQPTAINHGKRKKLATVTLDERTPAEPTQTVVKEAPKRGKANRSQAKGVLQHKAENDDCDSPLRGPASSVKSRSRKTASQQAPCFSCRQRHRACDRAQPVCGQCAKRSQHSGCRYPGSACVDTPIAVPTLSSDQTGPSAAKWHVDASRTSTLIACEQDNPQPSPRVHRPERFAVSRRAGGTAVPPSPVKPPITSSPARRAMPEITDYNTYLKLKAEEKIP